MKYIYAIYLKPIQTHHLILLKMKKKYLILALAYLLVQTTHAQEKNIRFGLKVAPNVGWISAQSANITPAGSKSGFGYGLMADFKAFNNEKYWISSGLEINSYGGKVKFDQLLYDTISTIEYTNVLYKYNLRYLDIPVSLKFKTTEMGYLTYYGTFGLKSSFLLGGLAGVENAPVTDDVVRVNDSSFDKYDFKQRFNNQTYAFKDNVWLFRSSLVIGGGMEYAINGGENAILVGLTLDQGFTGLFQDKQTKGRNSYISLNLGFFF